MFAWMLSTEFTSLELREKLDHQFICTKSSLSTGPRHLADMLWFKSGMKLFSKIKKMKEWISNGNPSNETFNATEAEMDFCMDLVKNDLVEVTVMFERPEFIRTSTSKRVSFPDQLGAFGNKYSMLCMSSNLERFFTLLGRTLGLFTGMSLLSMVEMLFWIVKCFINSLGWKKTIDTEMA